MKPGHLTSRSTEPVPCGEDDRIDQALVDTAMHPARHIVRPWSWKTAAVSALVRATIFLTANRHASGHRAQTAALVEALYSMMAAGAMGAITQRLRNVRPLWAAAITVWFVLPVCMVSAEFIVHRLVHTPHVRVGLAASFGIASISSGFTWFAMRRGVLLQGVGDDSLAHDLRALPKVLIEFVLWPLRMLRRPSQS